MLNLVLGGAALIALGIGTASAGQCTDEIGDVMISLAKQRSKTSSNFTVASASDPQKIAKLDELIELMERARVADRAGREQECMEIVKRIGGN
jgi:hypothetical protein